MNRIVAATVVLTLAGFVGGVRAADKPNPTGTWKWETEFGGQKRESTVKLKLEGDKLTGTMIGRDGKDIPIVDGKFKDGEASWKVIREFGDNKIEIKHSGKITGDTMKGKTEFEFQGETRTVEWEAKRSKD